MSDKLRIYVGFTNTHSPQSFRDQIQALKKRLTQEGYQIIDTNGVSPGNTYYRDIEHAIGKCNLFVAMCDHYATTLGMQIGAALWLYHTPTVAFAHINSSVTPLLKDISNVSELDFYRYQNIECIVEMINSTAKHL